MLRKQISETPSPTIADSAARRIRVRSPSTSIATLSTGGPPRRMSSGLMAHSSDAIRRISSSVARSSLPLACSVRNTTRQVFKWSSPISDPCRRSSTSSSLSSGYRSCNSCTSRWPVNTFLNRGSSFSSVFWSSGTTANSSSSAASAPGASPLTCGTSFWANSSSRWSCSVQPSQLTSTNCSNGK